MATRSIFHARYGCGFTALFHAALAAMLALGCSGRTGSDGAAISPSPIAGAGGAPVVDAGKPPQTTGGIGAGGSPPSGGSGVTPAGSGGTPSADAGSLDSGSARDAASTDGDDASVNPDDDLPPRDITLFLTSDTHFSAAHAAASQTANENIADAMNALVGAPYPQPLGGTVDPPRAVVISGDLTDTCAESEWQQFDAFWSVRGAGRVPFPVFEEVGNHDECSLVHDAVKDRNTRRGILAKVHDQSGAYSWDWGGAHFINLNMYGGLDRDRAAADTRPGREGEPSWCPECLPRDSLDFLVADLAENVGASGKPVVIFQHFGMDDWGNVWWTLQEQDHMFEVISGYNVVAIFAGHTHQRLAYTWRDIPIIHAQSTQKAEESPRGFLVVRLMEHELIVLERMSNGTWSDFSQRIPIAW